MVKEKSDQLGSIQKNNVYMQIQSVALVLELKTMSVIIKNFTCKSLTKLITTDHVLEEYIFYHNYSSFAVGCCYARCRIFCDQLNL